jgi:nucleoid-associated protein YgaU
VDAGFAVVRLLAVAAAAELAVTTVAGAAARVTGSTRMTAAVDRLTAAPLRALLSGAFGLGLATTALAGGVASAAPAPPAVETMVPVDAPATETMTPVDTWLVHRGESFWSIAAHVETDAHERVATNREVADYWRRLMAANRDKYRDADLIYPGQEFELPPG